MGVGPCMVLWHHDSMHVCFAMDYVTDTSLAVLRAVLLQVWEEVWDLPNTAALSGWLLMLITGELTKSVHCPCSI